jgi:phage-related protein
VGYKVNDTGRKQYNKGIGQTKQKQQSLTAAFLKANVIMGVAQKAIGAAFGFVRDAVIGATAETERYRVTLGTMIGDQEKANKIIHDLDYSPLSDFYGTANAIGGLQGMVTFGMQAEEASGILTRLGDVAQGNSEAFVTMSNNMGQVFAKGKANANNLKAFVNQGFDVVGEVAKQTGKSRDEIMKTGISYTQTKAALESLTNEGGKYNQMLAKQMNTLGGIIKQFQSFKAATAEAIGFGINEELKDILKYILEIARAGQDAFVGKFVNALKSVISWIFQIIIMWEVLQYRLEDMGAFETIGRFFTDLKTVAGQVLTGIMNLIVSIGKTFMEAFKVAYSAARPVILAIGELVQKVLGFIAYGIEGIIPIIRMLEKPLKIIGKLLGEGIKVLGFIFDFLKPLAPVIFGIIAAVAILNFVMSMNPIALIIIAVIALIGAISLLVKNFDKVKEFFLNIGKAIISFFVKIKDAIVGVFIKIISSITGFFKKLWNGIKSLFTKIVEFIKKNAMNILNIILLILFFPVGIVMAVVRLIIKHWDKIKETLIKVWEGIKSYFSNTVQGFINIWNGIKNFFSGLWEGIKNITASVWEGIKNLFFSIVDSIKNIWNSIIGFFSGLWEALKESPRAALEYIKNAFFGIFDSIKEKFFGFINAVKEGWEKVKGFLGGMKDKVVNFITGNSNKSEAQPVNDLIVTPNGQYSTHPDDYVMAMKNPLDIFDSLFQFLGGGQLQPAYVGSSQAAAAGAVGQTSNYSTVNYSGDVSSIVNANTSINVNVPPGTSSEQGEAIARQIDAQFNNLLSGSINSSRANIPSPEIRRN